MHLSAAGDEREAIDRRLADAVDALAAAVGDDAVSVDGRGLEAVLGDALRARGWRIGVAESCTGGLVTSRLTDVAGSSAYVDRSVVVYSNAAKIDLLAFRRRCSRPTARSVSRWRGPWRRGCVRPAASRSQWP